MIRAGIICEQHMAEDWLFPLLHGLNGTHVSPVYILIVARSTNKALAKRIIEFPGSPLNMEVHFCHLKEYFQDMQVPVNLDVFINITSMASQKWMSGKTKYGILQYDFHRTKFRTLHAPILKNYLPTVVHVLLMDPSGKEYIVETMQFKTIDHSVSKQVQFIKEAVYFTLPQMMVEISTNLFRMKRIAAYNEKKEPLIPGIYYLQFYTAWRTVVKYMRNLFQYNKWNIGIVRLPIQDFLEEPSSVSVSWLNEEAGLNFAADPFAIMENGAIKVMYEKYDNALRKGKIESVTFTDSFNAASLQMEKEFHLSYPYLFRDGDVIYMIPESSEASCVDLFRMESGGWKKVKTLIHNFEGVDPTVCKWEGRWWMFCTSRQKKGSDLRLYIYYSDTVEGTWKPHQLNPVKTSICSARPAGTPFSRDGLLFRPAQDSSRSYGRRIAIQEVTILTENAFEEREVACVQPWQFDGPYKHGVHTLSSCGNYTVIDAKRVLLSTANLFRIFRKN